MCLQVIRLLMKITDVSSSDLVVDGDIDESSSDSAVDGNN